MIIVRQIAYNTVLVFMIFVFPAEGFKSAEEEVIALRDSAGPYRQMLARHFLDAPSAVKWQYFRTKGSFPSQ